MVNVRRFAVATTTGIGHMASASGNSRVEEFGLVVLERGSHIRNAKMYAVKIVKQGAFA